MEKSQPTRSDIRNNRRLRTKIARSRHESSNFYSQRLELASSTAERPPNRAGARLFDLAAGRPWPYNPDADVTGLVSFED